MPNVIRITLQNRLIVIKSFIILPNFRKMNNLSVSVAIPAYNEEVNIENLLIKLIAQNRKNFQLEQITVYSDGSTDLTNTIVKKISKKNPLIRLHASKLRKGKIFQLNKIFNSCNTDIVFVLDGDIKIIGNNFLSQIITEFKKRKSVSMIVAHQTPLRPDNFIGKLLFANFILWDYIRFSVPNYDHVQNFYGAATAYRRDFARSLHIPHDAVEERAYIYLMAKKIKGFYYCRNAEIVYWPVTTLSDFLKLSKRSFGLDHPFLAKKFSSEYKKVYIIPWKYKILGILKSFYNQPFYTIPALILSIFLSNFVRKTEKCYTSLWEIAISSKKPYVYETD